MGKILPTPRQPPDRVAVPTQRDLGRPPSISPARQDARPAPRPRPSSRIASPKPPAAKLSILDALISPSLFEPAFSGPSWHMWHIVLKAAFALPMSQSERQAFRQVAGRDPPLEPVRELVAIAGRGGGKDSVSSAIVVWFAAFFDFKHRLRPGEKAVCMLLAVDRKQAGVCMGYVRGLLGMIPALERTIVRESDDEIELDNGAVIAVYTNSYRSIRGRTLICCVMSEVAFWRDEDSANPDVEVYGAVRPALARVPGSLCVLISTTHMRAGLLYDKWSASYGKDDPDTLVVLGGTLVFNPTFDRKTIDKDLARDPAFFNSEYNCEWRLDLSAPFDLALIGAATDHGVTVRPPRDGVSYVAACDASSGRSDSFTCCVAHLEGNSVIIDALVEWRAPFNASQVVREATEFLRAYGVHEVTGDKYAVGFTSTLFAEGGIKYNEKVTVRGQDGAEQKLDRSDTYIRSLPFFTSGRVRLPDQPRMAHQFAALERRVYPGGRDVIAKPKGEASHDDLANVVALAVCVAALGDRGVPWSSPKLSSGLQQFENEVLGPPRLAAVEPPKAGPGQSSFAEAAAIINERMRGRR